MPWSLLVSLSNVYMQAYLQMVRLEQERAEQQYKREEEERRKKREQAKRIKRMLEAAFDGETGEIKCLLSEVCVCGIYHN